MIEKKKEYIHQDSDVANHTLPRGTVQKLTIECRDVWPKNNPSWSSHQEERHSGLWKMRDGPSNLTWASFSLLILQDPGMTSHLWQW